MTIVKKRDEIQFTLPRLQKKPINTTDDLYCHWFSIASTHQWENEIHYTVENAAKLSADEL